ncbi:hypothetical protein PVL29_017788 [Vitis rotundifolia]|uniref:NB-ARC domain-containing protein n=1 Tax=Vitis rotundifolia TaxID=103349 RepID=A0AA39DKY9_VITRO|nr:hypothetical protein PVL29_017788 [Vitis rotundifolia]
MKFLDWDSLRIPLLPSAQGSKIVVTTRDETVTKTMGAVSTHRLKELSPENCWSLLQNLHFKMGIPVHIMSLNP